MRGSPLARFLLVAYVLLAVYASLYPMAGWRAPPASPFSYLTGGWPQYVTGFDIGANVFGYFPYGALCVLALWPRVRAHAALAAAVLSAATLSVALEAGQSYLPSRFPSNLDVACNVTGALLGALTGQLAAGWLIVHSPLRRIRSAWYGADHDADLGLVLLGLWLFAQLNPAMLLFGAGDLRDLLAVSGALEQPAALFVSVEAVTSASNLVAVALLLASITTPGAPVRRMFVLLVLAALLVKVLAHAILLQAQNVLAWMTPGAREGLVLGVVLGVLAVSLRRIARLALAAVLLMAATVLVNLAPPNPYFASILAVWHQGHFLNFNGLTRLVSSVWPFTAIGYLVWLASRRGRGAA